MESISSSSSTTEIAIDFSPYFCILKDGSIQRFLPSQFAPPSDEDPKTGVRSKDVVIPQETGVSVRLYLPPPHNITDQKKLPLFVYIHGGAFCLGSASSPTFHNFITSLVAQANVVAVSVDYRLAPENPLPIAYDDSWTAFQWVLSHAAQGNGPEPWLNDYADFRRVFLGGESAGANIASDVAIRAGVSDLGGVKIEGLLLIHPYFGGKQVDKLYKYLCPESSGRDDDPRLNPAVDPRLPSMACRRIMFCLAEKDKLRGRGRAYYEALAKSEWHGELEIMETEGEGHGFHLLNPTSPKIPSLLQLLASFLNQL